jgi:hypothetical protein
VDHPPPYSESYVPPPLPPNFPSPLYKTAPAPYVSFTAIPADSSSSSSSSPSEDEDDSSSPSHPAALSKPPLASSMTDPPPDAATYITQVQDHTLSLAARLAEVSIPRKEEEDVYCIYNMRGVRRDLRRRDAKLIPEPFAVHFKNGYMHVPWDQMTNWPWIPVSEVIGDDWEYRAIPVHDVPRPTQCSFGVLANNVW